MDPSFILQSFGCASVVLGCENLVCFCLFIGFLMVFVDVETVNPPLLSVGKKDRLIVCEKNKVSWIHLAFCSHLLCVIFVFGCENLVCFCLFLGFQKVFVDVETVNPPLLSAGKKDGLFVCGMNKVSWIKHQILQSFGCANLVLGCENLVCLCSLLGFLMVFVDV